jgi:hypothetical protein
MNRYRGLFIALAVGFVAIVGTATPARADGALPEPAIEQWRADLRYLAEQMPLRHKELFHTMTPAAFRTAVDRLDADIPRLNDDEITVRLFAIAAMPEDGHTGGLGYPPGTYCPLRLRHYAGGLYVESAPREYASAVGGRVLRIGNATAADVYEKLRPIIPHDAGNPGLLDAIGPVLVTSGHVLHGLGVEPTSERVTFAIDSGGRVLQLEMAPSVPFTTLFGHAPVPNWVDARSTAPPPLWLTHPDRPFWWTYVSASKIFYVQFNQVLDAKDETVKDFFEDAFKHAAQLPVDKLVLDIRENAGGNNYLLRPIIVGLIRLPSIDRPGHLFVITSRTTYSAAQNLVNRLESYTNAMFVGQPTGEHINSYGDPVPITLPNSHIRVGMASVWWQDADERDKRIETDPEIAADPTFADYVANRDPALDEIAAYHAGPSLEDLVLHAVQGGGADRGLAAYRAYASDPVHRYIQAGMERRINALGYDLLGKRRFSDALAVLRVNAVANPASANAADSLGEAYAAAGEREAAIDSYRRALQLNPGLETSRAALVRLGA